MLGGILRQKYAIFSNILILAGLYFVSRYNYAIFHSFIGIVIVIIGTIVFIIWNTRRAIKDISLEEAGAKYEAMFASIGDGLVITDKEGRTTFINKEGRRILSIGKSKIIGRIFSDLWTMEDEAGKELPYKKRPISIALRDAKEVKTDDYYYVPTGGRGKKVPVSIAASPIILRGKVIGAIDVFSDITKEKNRIIELEKFKLAVENTSDHIIITDADGIILYANKVAEKITGYSLKEMVGKKSGKLWGGLMPKEYYVKMWDIIKNKKQDFFGEITNRRKNGEKYEASIDIAPILNRRGEVIFFVGLERDITKEKSIDRAKTEFVSLASHQLRTPLSAIKWYGEMLMEKDIQEKDRKRYLKQLYASNERMIELVNSLLDVSHIEMGTLEVKPKAINIIDAANAVVTELSYEIKEKNIKFKEVFGADLPKINIDQKLIKIVFQNLLSNAVKYTPRGGRIIFEIKKNRSVVSISVRDTGIGIPASQQSKVFTKFFRADNAREYDPNGTGLGLYIVKSFLEKFGGKIWFESEENKGTVFYAELPSKKK